MDSHKPADIIPLEAAGPRSGRGGGGGGSRRGGGGRNSHRDQRQNNQSSAHGPSQSQGQSQNIGSGGGAQQGQGLQGPGQKRPERQGQREDHQGRGPQSRHGRQDRHSRQEGHDRSPHHRSSSGGGGHDRDRNSGGQSQRQHKSSPPRPTGPSVNRIDFEGKGIPESLMPMNAKVGPSGGKLRRYDVAIFETFAAARADLENLRKRAQEVDQINIVIKQEGSMDEADLTAVGKVFAGAAWALIHERRIEDGWYKEPRE